LAAYPEHQDAAMNEINNVWPSSSSNNEPFHITTMDDYAKFPFVLACYSETLRLFPPVQMIPKVAARDVTITVQASNFVEQSDPEPTTMSNFRPSLSNIHSTWSSSASTLAAPTPASEKNLAEADTLLMGTQPEHEATSHTSFVVKKGTIIFVDPPGVRE
jgi:Cytochrome P450